MLAENWNLTYTPKQGSRTRRFVTVMAEYLRYIVSSEGQTVTSMNKCIGDNCNAEADIIVQITFMDNSAECQSWSQAAVGEIAFSLGTHKKPSQTQLF